MKGLAVGGVKPFMQLAALVVVLSFTGCASVGVIPLSGNTARVLVEVSPLCSNPAVAAQELALHHASIATINRGFDRFVVQSAEAGSRTGNQYGSIARDSITIRMFRTNEEGAAEALDARTILGPDWEEVVRSGGRKNC